MFRETTRRVHAARFAREIALVAGAYMAYEAVRAFSAGRVIEAFDNAEIIVRVEQALGIFTELNLQVLVLGYGAATDIFSLWYFWGHFPLIIAFAIWAFFRHRSDYSWTRSAIFVAGAISLVVYFTFPVAPPRLLPGAGFVDTLRGVFALQYDDSSIVNQYAAVPSMHQGFALIVGVALYRVIGGRRGALLLFLLPSLMFVSIVATGNHWILDAVIGAAVAGVGMIVASRLERNGQALNAWLRKSIRRLRPPDDAATPQT